MATEPDPTTLTCENEDGNQAAGLVSHPLSDEDPTGTWYLYCDQCIGRFTDPEFRVIYLDPTRQRRPPAYLDGCTEPNHYCTNPDHIPALPHGHDRHPT